MPESGKTTDKPTPEPIIERPDLEPDDDAILDQVWDAIGKAKEIKATKAQS